MNKVSHWAEQQQPRKVVTGFEDQENITGSSLSQAESLTPGC